MNNIDEGRVTGSRADQYAQRYSWTLKTLEAAGWKRAYEGMFINDTGEAPPGHRPRIETWQHGDQELLLLRYDRRHEFTLWIPLVGEEQLPAFLKSRS